ncbi:HAD family hydrolase [Ramlibacter humi]|uniref:HAD family phosphatase n=1 Tax=Ramlibacter humi TaxID=2530451 RepID=A0A4Z0BG01_9BURK|nr:HAD family phosphatase [Ramlibacter humi]TFY97651.1 HAD family phosphatase [Ramlibacter humi]
MTNVAHAFILDMDGTMVDSMPAHAKSWDLFRRRHGVAMSTEEILRRTTGRNGLECAREVLGPQVPEQRAWELMAQKEADYREIFGREFREVAGFTAFARQARERGLKLAVATGGDRDNLHFVLQRLRLEVGAEVRGDMGLPGKPDPAIFLEAARRLGVAPAECIVFEDAPFGIEAAARAGMRAVAICTTHSARELAGAHVIAQAADFEELTKKNFLESLHA